MSEQKTDEETREEIREKLRQKEKDFLGKADLPEDEKDEEAKKSGGQPPGALPAPPR